ncbi:hypothetical protein BG20_I2375 [Candidatus Nitrosarchaeum limnium BG20]|uniref:Uncharacterized protein n=1 Tax=Candidatus Nitrosarchaeum limnium BG20 TaxID=859192 RepID=S2E509_9ARCH|nr:hypothetical protein BG20_I2375 [Candidatus Nitrosarchaeum limnium BG20]
MKNLEPAEMKLMMNMLKVAIHQEREFTSDESKNFNDLFVKIIENKIIGNTKKI